MKHARDDYNRIQDPAGLIPEDEPVFLLRGQDVFAPQALRAYANYIEGYAPDDHTMRDKKAIVDLTRHWAEQMEAWQAERHRKLPDLVPPTIASGKLIGEVRSVMDMTDDEVAKALLRGSIDE